MGMKAEPTDINRKVNIRDLTDEVADPVYTTAALKKQRTLIDNKDIRAKTSQGQQKRLELQAKIDAEERVRVPETDLYDDDNVTAESKPKTQK